MADQAVSRPQMSAATITAHLNHNGTIGDGRARVNFYHRNQPFFQFTNFWPCNNLWIDGVQWPSAEHYYQAMKFTPPALQLYFRELSTPAECIAMSRCDWVQPYIRADWHRQMEEHTIKERTMFNAVA